MDGRPQLLLLELRQTRIDDVVALQLAHRHLRRVVDQLDQLRKILGLETLRRAHRLQPVREFIHRLEGIAHRHLTQQALRLLELGHRVIRFVATKKFQHSNSRHPPALSAGGRALQHQQATAGHRDHNPTSYRIADGYLVPGQLLALKINFLKGNTILDQGSFLRTEGTHMHGATPYAGHPIREFRILSRRRIQILSRGPDRGLRHSWKLCASFCVRP